MNIKVYFIVIGCAGLSAELSDSRSPEWRTSRTQTMDNISSYSLDDQIKKLGDMVGPISTNPVMDEEQREIFERARSMLMKIPGHAEYYAKQIQLRRAVVEEDKARSAETGEGYSWNSYDFYRKGAFETLRQMPTPETVRVLGEMLNDERDHEDQSSPAFDRRNARQFGTNAGGASFALSGLRIALTNDVNSSKEVVNHPPEFWRVWYEEVKSGIRTFHFQEDPQEYNLQGAVEEVKGPVTGGVSRHHEGFEKQTVSEGAFSSKAQDEKNKQKWGKSLVGAFISAVVAIVAAAWYGLRIKSRRAS